jgi:hypothetical protein
MKKSFKEFLLEKTSEKMKDDESDSEKYKDTDCSCTDELSRDEKEYCDRKRLLKMLSDFRLRNN